jgi:DNA modification methylase
MPADSVHCVVTSPPYWGLRDYGTPPQVWGGDPDSANSGSPVFEPR